MIASGIALALNRKAAAGNEHDEAVGEPYMQALKISTTGHTVSKSEVAAIIDLPSHMDHWFSESSPRSQPVLITCIVPKHVMKDPTASIPSPVCSPSVLSSQQLQLWRAMAQAQKPGPSANGTAAVHSQPQMVPKKHAQESAKSQIGEPSVGEDMSSPANAAQWQQPSDPALAPQSPSPLSRKAVSRCFSEEWSLSSVGTDMTESSSEPLDQIFDISKSGDGSFAALSSVSSLDSSIRSCTVASGAQADATLDSDLCCNVERQSSTAMGPSPTADSQREALEATIASLRSELAMMQRDQLRTVNALTRKTQECENLVLVVRELTDSRCKLVNGRVGLMELVAELEHENKRLLHITDLSRTISRENLAKANAAYLHAEKAKDEAYKQRQTAAALRCANSLLEQEKDALMKRLESLTALQAAKSSENTGPSACMRAFTASRALKATY